MLLLGAFGLGGNAFQVPAGPGAQIDPAGESARTSTVRSLPCVRSKKRSMEDVELEDLRGSRQDLTH